MDPGQFSEKFALLITHNFIIYFLFVISYNIIINDICTDVM